MIARSWPPETVIWCAHEYTAANARFDVPGQVKQAWNDRIAVVEKGGAANAIAAAADVTFRDLVRETIRRLGEKKTILLSTHILQEVEALADRVILIAEGRKRFDGTPAELAALAYEEEKARVAEERWHGVRGGEPPRDRSTDA